MNPSLTLAPLREQPGVIEFLRGQFEREWPSWYGPAGPGDAMADLSEFANRDGKLPVGVVALGSDGSCLGVAALKASSIPEFAHLSPWASAGLVVPGWRRRGIGAALLAGLLTEARRLGFPRVYCATATAASLLERQGWRLLERTEHDGKPIAIYAIEVMLQGPGVMPASAAQIER